MNFEFVRHICAHGNELPAGPPPFYTGPRGPRSGNHSRTGKLMRTLFIQHMLGPLALVWHADCNKIIHVQLT